MKIDEFMETIKQIENFYGKEMIDEQKKIWYENLKNMKEGRNDLCILALYL